MSTSYISDILLAINSIYELSFLFPLKGTGARYGESVSNTIFSIGTWFKNSDIFPFLKVTTPPIPRWKFKSKILLAWSKFPVKQWKIPLSFSDLNFSRTLKISSNESLVR